MNTPLLLTLSVVEIALFVAVLVTYLVLIDNRLAKISSLLGKVAFGVRAVETQTGAIGPSVVRINGVLTEIDGALGPIVVKAEAAVRSSNGR